MTDHQAQARSYSATAGAYTREAERDAGRSATAYLQASRYLRSAGFLAGQPGLWRPWHNPATDEAQACALVRTGDTYLRTSFHATRMAAHYRELAARYRELHARRTASLAADVAGVLPILDSH